MIERRMTNRAGISTKGERQIGGYAAVYFKRSHPDTQFDLFGDGDVLERIRPGAFSGTLGQDVRALFNHDRSAVLGRTRPGTLQLSVDDVGLRYSIDLPDSPLGASVFESVKRGDVSGSSFGFEIGKQTLEDLGDGKQIRWIDEIRTLFDVGPVTFPAYDATSSEARDLTRAAILAVPRQELVSATGIPADVLEARVRSLEIG